MSTLRNQLVKCSNGGGWFIPELHIGSVCFEITIAGDHSGPGAAALQLAELHTAHVNQYYEAAISYLRSFVDPTRFESAGEWELLGFEFGFEPFPAPDFFALQLGLPDDIYGLWHVAFTSTSRPQPIAFGRRNW